MSIFSLGLNHQTAPIAFREKVAAMISDLAIANQTFAKIANLEEVITVSTCNRVEIYAVTKGESTVNVVLDWFRENGIEIEQKYFYLHQGKEVVNHLFRVVASLDSMILGENQIIAQVRTAFQSAEKVSLVGPVLRRVFEKAFAVAKKVRTDTRISEGAVSIGRAGVDLASQVLGNLSGKTAMIVGAGEHGQLIANNLKDQGVQDLYISNRTYDRAVRIATELSALPIRLSEIGRYLERCDIVVASIGGGTQVVSLSMVEAVLRARRFKPLVFIDLSVPRVFDSKIHSIGDAYLFDVDDLQSITVQGLTHRQQEALQAEQIVETEAAQCWTVLHVDQHNHSIGRVFQNANSIVETEMQRLEGQLSLSPEQMQLIQKALVSVGKKVLHHPVLHAKELAKSGQVTELQVFLSKIIPPEMK